MNDLFIFYVVFSYLYMLGAIIDFYDGKVDDKGISGALFAFLFSPVTMPVFMGMNK
tara:strand:+ start:388 stop:555 length:168 start_codon:yes stop_codon:yes gene_type:complete